MNINKIQCPLCGNTKDIKLIDSINKQWDLRRCQRCNFVFSFPRPTFEEIVDYYSSEYKYNYEPKPMDEFSALRSVRGTCQFIKTYLPDAKKILEIGCGYGHTLYGLKLCGLEVEGTDLSEKECIYAEKHYGIKVYNSEFPPKERSGFYDVIILSQVVEHIIEPKEFMESVALYLKQGGLVLIGTPNIDCIIFNLFAKNYEPIKPPEHISFFNICSMKKMLYLTGFETIKISTNSPIFEDYNLIAYLITSLLRTFRIQQFVRKRVNPQCKHVLACSTGITHRSKLLHIARKSMEYTTIISSIIFYPFIKLLDIYGKGLILFAIGRKR